MVTQHNAATLKGESDYCYSSCSTRNCLIWINDYYCNKWLAIISFWSFNVATVWYDKLITDHGPSTSYTTDDTIKCHGTFWHTYHNSGIWFFPSIWSRIYRDGTLLGKVRDVWIWYNQLHPRSWYFLECTDCSSNDSNLGHYDFIQVDKQLFVLFAPSASHQ